MSGEQSAPLAKPGDSGLGWTLRCFLIGTGDNMVRAVLERDFARWGLLGFFSASDTASDTASDAASDTKSDTLILRKGVGNIKDLKRPRYNLVRNSPSYWEDTRDNPLDLVKTRALATSEFGEATFDGKEGRKKQVARAQRRPLRVATAV